MIASNTISLGDNHIRSEMGKGGQDEIGYGGGTVAAYMKFVGRCQDT